MTYSVLIDGAFTTTLVAVSAVDALLESHPPSLLNHLARMILILQLRCRWETPVLSPNFTTIFDNPLFGNRYSSAAACR
ncbi:hypothetical protein GGU11DRAFT_586741 [Lentinula aff. detonsa]|nr:hypothetical protein GGU11DRAFT_586741 [Lentinula aff. detonsa]